MTEELTVSWSKLRAYTECRQKAFLQSTGHRNKAADIRIFAPGNVVDLAMRDWLANPSIPMRDLIPEVLSRFEQESKDTEQGVIRWRTTDDRSSVLEWCQTLADELEVILRELVLPHQVEVGYWFKAPLTIPYLDGTLRTIFLRGEMDIFVTTLGGDREVWDLKATENESYWRKTVGQLVFYDIACFLLTGQKTSKTGLIQPMCKMKVRPVEITDELRKYMLNEIVKYAHSVWKKDFSPKESNAGCSYCSVRHACAKYATKPGSRKMNLLGEEN